MAAYKGHMAVLLALLAAVAGYGFRARVRSARDI